jgi:hypothetical protein
VTRYWNNYVNTGLVTVHIVVLSDNGRRERESLPVPTNCALDFSAYWNVYEGYACRLLRLAVFEKIHSTGYEEYSLL